ncbi:14402_t:CDS:2, partial [Funneliformis caledonium]
ALGIQDYTYQIDECEKINYHTTIWVNHLKRVERTADNEINLRRVQNWLKNLEDNLLQAERIITELENLSPKEVRRLLEKEHEKTLKAIGLANTVEKRVQELTRVIYGRSPSPPPKISSSHLEFDDEIL